MSESQSPFPFRHPGRVSRLRWALMPWWAFAWRYRDDFNNPETDAWWKSCIGSTIYWLDKVLEHLPGGDLFAPYTPPKCDCDYCRGVPGAVFEP
jgi:hypothetical protein